LAIQDNKNAPRTHPRLTQVTPL
jgi:hypothetical protein